jgi:predicted enzyme related to lactoylglutathione lyase
VGEIDGRMKRVIGIGGVFLRARNSKRLAEWYRKHLCMPVKDGVTVFAWRGLSDPKRKGHTVWAVFPENTEYFGKKRQRVMVNYRVRNLRSTLGALREEGVRVEDKIEESSYGKFGWIFDPEGNRIELWQPPKNYRTPEKQFPSE